MWLLQCSDSRKKKINCKGKDNERVDSKIIKEKVRYKGQLSREMRQDRDTLRRKQWADTAGMFQCDCFLQWQMLIPSKSASPVGHSQRGGEQQTAFRAHLETSARFQFAAPAWSNPKPTGRGNESIHILPPYCGAETSHQDKIML